MAGTRKLLGLTLCVAAVAGLTIAGPVASVPAGVGAVVALYGAFVAGNYGEHRTKRP